MRIGSALLVIWLIIGAIAGAQRHYYSGNISSCTKASTIIVTILAGPLNYVGVNPKVVCHVPERQLIRPALPGCGDVRRPPGPPGSRAFSVPGRKVLVDKAVAELAVRVVAAQQILEIG